MNAIQVKGAKTLFQIGPIAVTETALSLLAVTVLLFLAAIVLGRNLKKRPGPLQVLTEKGVGMLMNMVSTTMGAHNIGWTPYIGTIFLSSLLGSFMGMTGFLRSTTADLAVVLSWSVMTSAIIWYQSIKRKGFLGWLKGFAEPIVIMTPMNLVSEIAQPMAMAFRHFGNVAGGGIITMIVYTALSLASAAFLDAVGKTVVTPIVVICLAAGLLLLGRKKKKLPYRLCGILLGLFGITGLLTYFGLLEGLQIPILQIGVPAVLSVYFDLFSGFVQAFVFSLLSMVYIAGACPEKNKNGS